MKSELAAVQRVFKALADPTRLRIVGLLLGGEICVCHIYETLNIPQSKASRHLAYLRRTGVVVGEKRGLWVYYRIVEMVGRADGLLTLIRGQIGELDIVKRDRARLAKALCSPVVAAPLTFVSAARQS